MSWFYGLVKQKDGKIRIWEIYEEKKYLWGHPGVVSWMLRDFISVIRDLLGQRKYLKKLFDGEELEKGNKKQTKKWAKQIKELNLNKLIK